MSGDRQADSDKAGAAAALASLGVSPARLRRLLSGRAPVEAWQALASGRHPEDPRGAAQVLAGAIDPSVVARRCSVLGVSVHVLGESGYPAALAADAEAPAVLFVQGSVAAVDRRPVVAVVGTRSATAAGREVAGAMGRHLAASGVVVVSGLARGVDTAALAGALAGPGAVGGAQPVAVLGSSHDASVPEEQRALRTEVARAGAVLSELPPGAPGARWRFAVRNRLMAAMAQLVLVVECHQHGGAMHTVRAALRRGVEVAAVPGSVRSPASAGTNQLLVDGSSCVRSGEDVVALLGRLTGWAPDRLAAEAAMSTSSMSSTSSSSGDEPTGPVRAVLDALDHEPVALDTVVLRCGVPLGTAAAVLERLSDGGQAVSEGGYWRRR